jgi:hypothetical protein
MRCWCVVRRGGKTLIFFSCGSETGKLELLRDLGEPPGLSLHYVRAQDRLFLSRYWPGRFVFEKMREMRNIFTASPIN